MFGFLFVLVELNYKKKGEKGGKGKKKGEEKKREERRGKRKRLIVIIIDSYVDGIQLHSTFNPLSFLLDICI